MIHHVGLEVHSRDLDACVTFWRLLGWHEVAVPDGIGDAGRWMQFGAQAALGEVRGVAAGGAVPQQIHLQVVDAPSAPEVGHVALVDGQLDATVERLAAAGFEVLERTRYWGARRIFTRSPGGHRVELMSAPPGGADLGEDRAS